MRWTSSGTAVAVAVVAAACAAATEHERAGAVDAEKRVLAVVRDLTGHHPFRLESVSKTLGHWLRENPGRSTEYFLVYESKDPTHDLFTEVELRVPRDPGSKQGGLLILTVNPAVCVGREAVLERFGRQPELVVPTPREPATAPLHLKYSMAWGTVSFGFPRQGRECLTDVVLDGTEA
jgi:hypothetical protein